MYYLTLTIVYIVSLSVFISLLINVFLACFGYLFEVRRDKQKVAKLKEEYFDRIDEKILFLEDCIIKQSTGLIKANDNKFLENQIKDYNKLKNKTNKNKLVSDF